MQTLRSVPHLTVTWPNQQLALIPRRSGLFSRNHQVKDHHLTKRQSGLQQVHPQHGDDDNTAGQIISSLGSCSSWSHKVNTTVDSQSPTERLSPPNLPITTDDWTIIDAASNMDFNVSSTVPLTLASEQLRVSQAHVYNVPPETEENRERQRDGFLCIDGVAPDSFEWSGVVSDGSVHSKGEIATLSPV